MTAERLRWRNISRQMKKKAENDTKGQKFAGRILNHHPPTDGVAYHCVSASYWAITCPKLTHTTNKEKKNSIKENGNTGYLDFPNLIITITVIGKSSSVAVNGVRKLGQRLWKRPIIFFVSPGSATLPGLSKRLTAPSIAGCTSTSAPCRHSFAVNEPSNVNGRIKSHGRSN